MAELRACVCVYVCMRVYVCVCVCVYVCVCVVPWSEWAVRVGSETPTTTLHTGEGYAHTISDISVHYALDM